MNKKLQNNFLSKKWNIIIQNIASLNFMNKIFDVKQHYIVNYNCCCYIYPLQ